MNSKVKEIWCKALESGKYNQTTGCLKDHKGFCCLGVLTNEYMDSHPELNNKWIPNDENDYSFKDSLTGELEAGILPEPVSKWAGLDYDPYYKDGQADCYLSNLNDSGSSFKDIAKIIREKF